MSQCRAITEHMHTSGAVDPGADGNVNYDEPAIAEITIEETDYRVDSGKQGTALCVSTRPSGSWDWHFDGEVRFDGRDLRSKTLSREVRMQLALALRDAAEALSTD